MTTPPRHMAPTGEITPDTLLTTAQTGAHLGGQGAPLSTPTLARWRSEGNGPPFVRIGSLIRYRVRDLDAWLEAQTVDPKSAA